MELLKEALWTTKDSRTQTLAIAAGIAVLAMVPLFTRPTLFLAWILAYSVMALMWTFFSGKTGYISLASAAFMGIGMYMQALLGHSLPLAVTMVISAAFAFGAALGIGVITLRLRGIYFTIFTFGLALFLQKAIRWYEVTYNQTKGRMVKAYENEAVFYALIIVLAIVIIAVIVTNKSRFGLSLVCIGQNEDSAQHVGVNTIKTKVLAFAISAAPVGAVGAVMSTTIGYVDPDIAFRLLASFFPALMAIFGGMRYTYGPIVGSVVFYTLEHLLRLRTEYYIIIFGVIMIVVILVIPKGLFGLLETITAKRRGGASEAVIRDV